MSSGASKSVTLLELLISLVLIGLVVLGLSNIELFCRNQLLSSDRRLKVQNDASFVVEHMAKNIGKAIGDTQTYPIIFTSSGSTFYTQVIIDRNDNGIRDVSGPGNEDKYRIAYEHNTNTNIVSYCSSYDKDTSSCRDASGVVNWEILASHIINRLYPPDIDTHAYLTNYISVNITACWDPSKACGTSQNPQTQLRSRIIMPSVSIR